MSPNRQGRLSLALLSVVIVMMVSSCQGGFSSRPSSVDVHVGSKGIEARFMPSAPPVKVMENVEFPVILELENQGTGHVQNGLILFSGDSGFITIEESEGSFSVEGRSKSNPFPGKALIERKAQSLELDPQRQIHEASITATLCYPYETKAGINVCIDTDPLNLALRKKPCSVSSVSGARGQGAPLVVAEIEPSMIPEGEGVIPSFVIRLQNQGGGLIVDPRKVSLACQPLAQSKDLFDRVDIQARLTDTPLVCDSKVKLEDGKAEVECVSPDAFSRALGAYMAPLTINVRYGYTQSLKADVKIERRN